MDKVKEEPKTQPGQDEDEEKNSKSWDECLEVIDVEENNTGNQT